MDISCEQIKTKLNTCLIGNNIEIFSSIDSTNKYLKSNGYKFDNGYVVIANEQTEGVGTKNKIFYSPKKEGIYLSILIKPEILFNDVKFITVISCIAVKNVMTSICKFTPKIKWINDLFYDDKKFCGILTESKISRIIDFIVVGIGINTGYVAQEVKDIATSIYCITGKHVCRNVIIANIINEFETLYLDFLNNRDKSKMIADYVDNQLIINRTVKIIFKEKIFYGEVIDIDNDLNITVKDIYGEVTKYNCEEVSISI